MKASLVSKIIMLLCILSLIAGVFLIDKNKPYIDDNKVKSNKTANIISNANKVAVMELEGAIASSYDSGFFTKEHSASALLKSLINAQTDNEIRGVIIKINSPGGTVAMSQNIYNQIMKLRQKKPIIVVMDDVAASGGYYIASAADRIIAQEGTLTGSIGVIFSYMDYHNLLADKLSVKPVVIKSGKYKDIGSSTREMTAEERELMQNIINDSYSQFLDAVTNGRINRTDTYTAEKTVLTPEVLKAYADGRIFTGRQAQKIGYVDSLGDIDSAKSQIEKMMQQKFKNKLPAKLISYNKKSALSEYLSGFSEYNSEVGLKDFIPTSMILSRRPLYLWE